MVPGHSCQVWAEALGVVLLLFLEAIHPVCGLVWHWGGEEYRVGKAT